VHVRVLIVMSLEFRTLNYGVATCSRLFTIIGLFCRILSLLQGSFAKETYHFKEPTNRSHPISTTTPVHISIHDDPLVNICTGAGVDSYVTSISHTQLSIYVYIYPHVCMQTRMSVCVCVYVQVRVLIFVSPVFRTHNYPYIYIHISTRMYADTYECLCMCVCAGAGADICVTILSHIQLSTPAHVAGSFKL